MRKHVASVVLVRQPPEYKRKTSAAYVYGIFDRQTTWETAQIIRAKDPGLELSEGRACGVIILSREKNWQYIIWEEEVK